MSDDETRSNSSDDLNSEDSRHKEKKIRRGKVKNKIKVLRQEFSGIEKEKKVKRITKGPQSPSRNPDPTPSSQPPFPLFFKF